MPYYLGEGEPEWDEYMNMLEDSDGHTEPPISLFKYVEPWIATTTVLQFPDTPGPQPEENNTDSSPQPPSPFESFMRERKLFADRALWNISRVTAKCRARGIKRVFGDYDGGGDESFTYFCSIEMSDGRVVPMESIRTETNGVDCEKLILDAASALMGYFDAGEFVLHGALVIDFDACTVTDEKDVNVVFGQ